MNVGVFNNVRGGLERFMPYVPPTGELKLIAFPCGPTIDHLDELEKAGCEAFIYQQDYVEPESFYQALADKGVKYVLASSAGYDQFNVEAMRKYGLKGANVPKYSPNAVSEHTVMIVLALLRKLRIQFSRIRARQYHIDGLMGRELRQMTVGIVGAGRIGYTTMQCLSGFGPKEILAYDLYPNDAVRRYARYVTLDELYGTADIVIFHCAYTKDNYHMVDDEAISKMKRGVILVNSARGQLFDAAAVLRGLDAGQIGAAGMDVLEGESALRRPSEKTAAVEAVLSRLLDHENVIYTPHTAFYTDQAEHNLTEETVSNLLQYARTGRCDNEVVQV